MQVACKRPTLDIRCHDEEPPLCFAKLYQRQNMFVLEMSTHLGLTQKARTRREIVHKIGANNFHCHFAVESRSLACQVDFAHTPDVDATYQVVVPKTKPALIFQHFIDPGRWILTVQGLVAVLFSMGRFLIPIVLVLALYWYLVRFQVDSRDRAALATAGIALGLTLAAELVVDILFVDNLALEVSTSFERCLLQLWPAGLLMFFLASGPLQLVAAEKVPEKGKPSKKAPKPARSVAGTR